MCLALSIRVEVKKTKQKQTNPITKILRLFLGYNENSLSIKSSYHQSFPNESPGPEVAARSKSDVMMHT